ncbi:MAG: aldo/keto reductase [Patescibacteria group bacterium]|nr:aldo/keto reductase [Patescibacteria group bacterium]
MSIPTKKLKTGLELPVIGLGTWAMGGRNEPDPNNDDLKDIGAIKSALSSGITVIDTAEVYAAGQAEKFVGQAILGQDRKKLFISSKAQQTHLNYRDIKQAALASLKRLGTDYLDLYYLHRYPGEEKIGECMKALDELADEGLIKHLGISNFNLEHTKQAQELARHPIEATQVHYSVRFREPEKSGLLEYCQTNDIFLVAWRPLGMGSLTRGKTDLDSEPLIQKLCDKYKKTPAQIAINWLVMQPNVVTLTKTSSQEHLKENLGAVGWIMAPEDVKKLQADFSHQENISDTIPLA